MEDAGRYLEVGQCAEAREVVADSTLASRYGSGTLDVYATPAMIALMERASVEAVDDRLPGGWMTVGISVNVRHLAATPPGSVVRAVAELVEIDGCRLIFSVTAWDEQERIGKGTHQRYCVEREPFTHRAQMKMEAE